ncbi:MAG: hypothetical protein KKD90_04790 [Candidatus Omnitrophica bacterium]|nr:hypothetical protein [Candidatus Omnitrophota bacterium]MBU4149973.1 hypothetical protein [Candidatus Omnitrophota bacterium]
MTRTKRALGCLILCLAISSCAMRSKAIKEADLRQNVPKPAVKEEVAIEQVEEKITIASAPAPSIDKAGPFQPAVPEKITYDQITNLIGEFLEIKAVDNVSGQPRFVGTSENKLVTLEMIGDKDNISIASIKLVYPDDIEPINSDLNNAIAIRFLKNVAPENKDWSSSIKDIVNKFHSLQIGDKKEETILFNTKEIKIVSDKNANAITVITRYQ